MRIYLYYAFVSAYFFFAFRLCYPMVALMVALVDLYPYRMTSDTDMS